MTIRTWRAIAASSLLLFFAGTACSDDPARGRLGASCDAPADCESGLCTNQVCVNPAGGACTIDAHCVSGVCTDGECGGAQIGEPVGTDGCGPDGEVCAIGSVCDVERGVCVPESN